MTIKRWKSDGPSFGHISYPQFPEPERPLRERVAELDARHAKHRREAAQLDRLSRLPDLKPRLAEMMRSRPAAPALAHLDDEAKRLEAERKRRRALALGQTP